MKIQGTRVLLTGATGGIGRAIAHELHLHGAELVLTGRRENELSTLAGEVNGTALIADLALPADLERIVDEAGQIDILVANAGLPGSGELLDHTVSEIDSALAVNLRSPIVLTRMLLPEMLERGRGHFVYISSISGKVAANGTAIYSATKFGLRGFATALRADLHGTPVGASTVFPGFIRDAGMFHEAGVKLPKGVGTRSPEQVATAVARAIERASEVLPTPGGPTKHKIGPLILLRRCCTARYSRIRSLTFSRP